MRAAARLRLALRRSFFPSIFVLLLLAVLESHGAASPGVEGEARDDADADAADAASFFASIDAFVQAERGQPFEAVDASSRTFDSSAAFWEAQHDMPARAHALWASADATRDAVLGNHPSLPLHDWDVGASRTVLQRWLPGAAPRCLSVCAGIGREAAVVLAADGACGVVDLLEPAPQLLAAAQATVPPHVLGDSFPHGVAEHRFDARAPCYGVVWLQYCTGYLRDRDVVRFLIRAGRALCEGGVVVVKDNYSGGSDGFADDHAQVMRSRAYLHALAHEAARGGGPVLVEEVEQTPWSDAVFPQVFLVFAARSLERAGGATSGGLGGRDL